jgi:hypothetical protein
MAEEDMSRMIFHCPGVIGLFEWVVMTFGLKKWQWNISKGHELDLS